MYQAQIITSVASGKPEFAVLPSNDYIRLLELKAKAAVYDNVDDYPDYQEAAYIIQTDTGRIPFEEIKRELQERSAGLLNMRDHLPRPPRRKDLASAGYS